MPKEKFKYRINHYLMALPRAVEIRDIENLLRDKHNISRSTFSRDRVIGYDSEASIPTDRLDAYAVVLGVNPDQLKNYSLEGESIFESKQLPNENLNTGLVK